MHSSRMGDNKASEALTTNSPARMQTHFQTKNGEMDMRARQLNLIINFTYRMSKIETVSLHSPFQMH